MRPQHITAENGETMSRRRTRPSRFNEAAAYHCGKPAAGLKVGNDFDNARFNEAAAYHCGKLGVAILVVDQFL